MSKIALVTGASRGLGLETARRLGRRDGYTVIVGAREAAAGERAVQDLRDDGVDAEMVILDVTSPASVADAAGRVGERHGRLDVLVNNAGILPEATEATSSAGRIVNVSSTMGSLADQVDPDSSYYNVVVPAYQGSKAALNAFTIALSKTLADTDIKVNSVCPGWLQTGLGGPDNRAAAPTTAAAGAEIVVEMACLPDEGPTGSFVDRDGPVAW